MMSSLLQAVVVSILEFIVYILHERQLKLYKAEEVLPNDKALSVYYILFIISQIFQLILCLDATYNKNTIQVIALAVFNFLSLGYSIIQHIQAQNIINSAEFKQNWIGSYSNTSRNLEFAIIALMLLFSLSFAYQAYQLYQEYGWSIYKKIGADLRMRSMYKVYQILLMLLKVDVFFLLGFSIQYLVLVITESSMSELIVHVTVSLGGTVSMMILSFWALRAENRLGIISFMLACLMTIGYLVYKLVIMYTVEGYRVRDSPKEICKNPPNNPFPPECDRFAGSRYFLTFFVVVCLLLLFATIVETYKALRNFGQGLKQHINRTAVNWNGAVNLESPEAQKRWSID
ncbi:hypothetical protein K493DRAFT_260252 [Basidiobolus meristosporus CBS 931.73]|uniref:TRP C-terminal domain-containing protein n=1 Tax=Basidiobolus meristosporus CBS 931.73 TaxID=1314790 RepID=A0A1Y1YCQ9_9FUNG|nr:hypothetical protein K493DRAFT_260252 [Basidiobolus meristosporus CBS 931.73]|eukprot:ORX95778.1 hypothetical protein K493DRAFT_260252 [Basidiobolus meristosporus CBS 931.73]